jgi:hypothetical protein
VVESTERQEGEAPWEEQGDHLTESDDEWGEKGVSPFLETYRRVCVWDE